MCPASTGRRWWRKGEEVEEVVGGRGAEVAKVEEQCQKNGGGGAKVFEAELVML